MQVGDAESGGIPRRRTGLLELLLLSLFLVPPLWSVFAGVREREHAALNAGASSRALERLRAAQEAWEENERRFPRVDNAPYCSFDGALPPTAPGK